MSRYIYDPWYKEWNKIIQRDSNCAFFILTERANGQQLTIYEHTTIIKQFHEIPIIDQQRWMIRIMKGA